MSAIEDLEKVVDELGIRNTIKALARIAADCSDDSRDDDEPEKITEQWEQVAEALDDIDTGELD